MDGDEKKSSPFASADQVPLHRAAPLAPSQELAYRRKCIQLRRRLTEIEVNNDATRRRIEQEKSQINKLRLNRAVLLNQLKEFMDAPSHKLSPEEVAKLAREGRLAERVGALPKRTQDDYMLEDSTEESDDDEIPQVRNPIAQDPSTAKVKTIGSRKAKAPGTSDKISSKQPRGEPRQHE